MSTPRTVAEIVADWNAPGPVYPVSPTPEAVRKYDLDFADHQDRIAELFREVAAMPPADRPAAIVGYALDAAWAAARESAAERRRWHA